MSTRSHTLMLLVLPAESGIRSHGICAEVGCAIATPLTPSLRISSPVAQLSPSFCLHLWMHTLEPYTRTNKPQNGRATQRTYVWEQTPRFLVFIEGFENSG